MILIDDVKRPVAEPSPSALEAQPDEPGTAAARRPLPPPPATAPSPTSSSPLLPRPPCSPSAGTYASLHQPARSSSPPPEYTPEPAPPLSKESRRAAARRRLVRVLVGALGAYVVLGLVVGAWTTAGGSSGRRAPGGPSASEGAGGPSSSSSSTGAAGPTPTTKVPKTPAVPDQPANKWDSSFYLPPLAHGHVLSCAPLAASSPAVTYDLPLPMPTLALRLGAARPRRSTTHRNDPGPGDEDDGQRPVDEPEVDVRVLPWVEDDPAWGEWAEGAVKVVVEVAPSEESLGGGGGGGALQVCRMGDYEQASVGIYSGSARPPRLIATLLVPLSDYTDRFVASLLLDGVAGSVYVGDMLLADAAGAAGDGGVAGAAPDIGSASQPGWTALDVRMQRGEVLIDALDVETLSIVSRQATDVVVGAMRVSRRLDVSTGADGAGRVVIGNLLLEPDCVCSIDSHGGAVNANVSLVARHAPPDLVEPTDAMVLGAGVPGLPHRDPPDLPAKPRLPSHPPLTILHPVKLSVRSGAGNITLRVLEHLPHIPLQASLSSAAGSVAAYLGPSFQGYFSLASPLLGSVSTVLPPSGPTSTIPDPFGLSRALTVRRAQFAAGTVEASVGWGWAGKPDLEGSVKATADRGAVRVEMAPAATP